MAAPTFVGAGAGVTIASGSAAVTAAGSGVAVGDLIVLQVLQDGTAASAVTYSAISGIANLAGTASSLTTLATDQPCGSPTAAKQHLRVGRATSTTCSVTVATTGDDLYYRIYVFRNVNTGTALSDILENGTAGTIANGAGLNLNVTDTAVTTLGADRLALQFVAVDDDNPIGAFVGVTDIPFTGGIWAEAVAEFASATGTDGCIQLQLGYGASIDNTATAGGTRTIGSTASLEMYAQSFAPAASTTLKGVSILVRRFGGPADGLVVEIRSDSGGSPSSTVLGTASLPNVDMNTTFELETLAFNLALSASTTYWIVVRRAGALDASNYYLCETASVAYAGGVGKQFASGAWGSASTDLAFAVLTTEASAGTINGGEYAMAASDSWGVIGFALIPVPSGPTTWNGTSAVTLTGSRTAAGTKQTFATTAVTLTDTRIAAGTRKTFSTAAVALFNAITTSGLVRKTSAAAVQVATVIVTAGVRKTFGVTATGLTANRTANATFTAKAVATRGQIATITTSGTATSGSVTYFGVATVALTNARTTAGTRKTFSTTTVALTNSRVTNGTRKTFGVIARNETVTVTTSGQMAGTSFGAAAVQLTNQRVTAATRKTFGTITRNESVLVTTSGTVTVGATTHSGSATVTLTNLRVTAATRTTFGQIARAETILVTTQGNRAWYGTSTTGETVTVTTSGSRIGTGLITVDLHVALNTIAGTQTPIPAGRIEHITIGGIDRTVHRGIDHANQGGLARSGNGAIARTVR